MTKNNYVDIKNEILSEKKTFLNPAICLKVEELLKTTEPDNKLGIKCAFPHRNDLDCRLIYCVNQAILRLDIPEAEQDQMFCHYELYKLTDQTLTDSEFGIMFPFPALMAVLRSRCATTISGAWSFF